MRAMARRVILFSCLVTCLLAPRIASAITIDQVIALAKAGVTDTVILALIDRDRTVFAIEPEQIVTLQQQGLSEPVILALLKSGRDEGEAAARADSANNSAWIASNLLTEPLSISVGHGPDRPNTAHVDGFYSGPPAAFYDGGFYGFGGGFYGAAPRTGPSFRAKVNRRAVTAPSIAATPPSVPATAPSVAIAPPALCYAQISTAHTWNQAPFVTVCPDVMQPRRAQR
jgi:hypothetical protein